MYNKLYSSKNIQDNSSYNLICLYFNFFKLKETLKNY